jgi:LAO/AO transport system kinase
MNLAADIVAGSQRAIARAITQVENELPGWIDLLKAVYPHTGRAYIIGFTGPGGSGKSTLVDRVADLLCSGGASVGIVAVDPSSPFTGGALLGDRVRMHDAMARDNVFFRSLGSRGGLGGLARATSDVIKIIDASGKDFILIETIGIGQDEVEIVKVADSCVLLSVPGLGDDIQTIKAGIMEIGDILVVNKADRDGADHVAAMLTAMQGLAPLSDGWQPPVIKTVATERRGIDELLGSIMEHRRHLTSGGQLDKKRKERIARDITALIEDNLARFVCEQMKELQAAESMIDRVYRRKDDPYSCAERMMSLLDRKPQPPPTAAAPPAASERSP